jgi:hypothetical protein
VDAKGRGRQGEKTTAANAVIPKITPIVRMTLAAYEALKVGHLKDQNNHQRALLAIGSYGRGQNAQPASARRVLGGDRVTNVRFRRECVAKLSLRRSLSRDSVNGT